MIDLPYDRKWIVRISYRQATREMRRIHPKGQRVRRLRGWRTAGMGRMADPTGTFGILLAAFNRFIGKYR